MSERAANGDYADMLRALNEAGAEYLVVGAHALGAHGYARSTGDIDLWLRPTAENAQRVLAALRQFGAPTFGTTADELCAPGIILQLGLAPSRIDLLTSIDGVSFDEAWPLRVEATIEGVKTFVLGLETLRRNKLATGRLKDVADAEVIAKLLERK